MHHLCIYHSADLDGKCSGAIVSKALLERGLSVELYGLNYGEEFPWDRISQDTNVIMVDFSLQPFSQMIELNSRANRLTWIDHHKSAIDDYKATNCAWDVSLDTDQAACELTWKYYYPREPMPRAVHLLGRYDIWAWKDCAGALQFQYGMRGIETGLNAGIWESVLMNRSDAIRVTESLITAGGIILQYVRRQDSIYAESTSFPLEWENLRLIASNAQLVNSQMFDAVFDPKKYDGMLTFAFRKGKWHISLYSTPEILEESNIDLGALAKKYGGGGHRGAAGFRCSTLPTTLAEAIKESAS